MQFVLFEDESTEDLFPLTLTRPVYNLRVGIDLISEKWNRYLGVITKTQCRSYLSGRYEDFDESSRNVFINGKFLPDPALVSQIKELQPGEKLLSAEEIVAARPKDGSRINIKGVLVNAALFDDLKTVSWTSPLRAIRFPQNIFSLNAEQIKIDFADITAGRKSAEVQDKYTVVYGAENIFIEPGAKIRAAVLNAEDGPIYIGKDADIQEGAMIHGTHAILDHADVNMGAKLRGDSTIGPYCKIGGEISNCVIWGYSNKAHDGFLGNAVIGSWCNLGADTNNSNLKNNYANVKIWNYRRQKFIDTGLQFCGLIMGDHSKCGINTMFNTGTVVGVSANIFGDGFPRNFIPSFSWGGAAGFTTFALDKAFEVAEKVMARRNVVFDENEKAILSHVFEKSAAFRFWEKSAGSVKTT